MLVDDEASEADSDGFVVDDDGFVVYDGASEADDAAYAATEDAPVVAHPDSTVWNDKLVQQPEADKNPAAPTKALPRPKGRKRAASSERPLTEGSVVVATRVLPDRRAKGKGVAR